MSKRAKKEMASSVMLSSSSPQHRQSASQFARL